MTVSTPPPRSRLAALRALFEEARKRARRRRSGYAIAAAATLLLGLGSLMVLHDRRDRVADEASPSAPASVNLELERMPYMGVSCPEPSGIACDRVGLAIWLRKPVTRLMATINGRTLAMHLPCWNASNGRSCKTYCQEAGVRRDQPCGTYYEGFLQPAGLLEGPLEVRPDRGVNHWSGIRPPRAVVRIFARYRGGQTATARLRIALSSGWG